MRCSHKRGKDIVVEGWSPECQNGRETEWSLSVSCCLLSLSYRAVIVACCKHNFPRLWYPELARQREQQSQRDSVEAATFSLAWLLAADELRGKLCSAVPRGTAIHSQIMPTSRFCHCKSFITATAGPVEPEGQADHLTICVTSQSGILLSGQKLWNCLRDPFQLNSSFPG